MLYGTALLRWSVTDDVGTEWGLLQCLLTGALFVAGAAASARRRTALLVALGLLLVETPRRCGARHLGPGLLLADWFGAMGWGTDALADQQTGRRHRGGDPASSPRSSCWVPPSRPRSDAAAPRADLAGGSRSTARGTRMNAALEVALTPAQQAVIDAVGGADITPLLVTGRAGTGKSTLLHHIVASSSSARSRSCAPTGVAALNVGGQTIHSLLGCPSG